FFPTRPPPTDIYTLSLHDALPIYMRFILGAAGQRDQVSGLDLARHQRLPIDETDDRPQQKIDEHDESGGERGIGQIARSGEDAEDRKSTRLNSSHVASSYAVFCLK